MVLPEGDLGPMLHIRQGVPPRDQVGPLLFNLAFLWGDAARGGALVGALA